jgi:sigma-B regulation protein RsbU (phosphoserine phosphatase)
VLRSGRKMRALDKRAGEPATARFYYLDAAGKECRVAVTSPRFTLGRSSLNDLVISQGEISRFHAELLTRGDEYVLRDLGSKGGTYVNGAKIDQAVLRNGDRIQLGDLQSQSISFHTGDLLQSLLSQSDLRHSVNLPLNDFREIGKLFAAFRALSSIPLLDDLLALVVDTAIELTAAERGFIMLREMGDELNFRCARNSNRQSLEGSCFQTSQRVPQDVFETGKPVTIIDLDFEEENERHNETRKLGLRSICCVPLRHVTVRESGGQSIVAKAEIIGVLYIDSSSTGAELSGTRIDALETLASEAAIAIHNARLYKDSQDKRKMDEQLVLAREIQQALLPRPEREMPYLRASSCNIPCFEIGGDFFDYFDLSDGRFGFTIGDVAGKGMPAALLASMVQGAFSTQSFSNVHLPEVIEKVNRKLVQRGPGNRFITFFMGILDCRGRCIYVNAGHNPPLLLSCDGTMKELTEGGMVLGLFAESQYESGAVSMQPGDHIVLFTDGVIEALNPQGEEFGADRLNDLLRRHARSTAHEIMARIREAVLSFAALAPQHDDITLMVLDYDGNNYAGARSEAT